MNLLVNFILLGIAEALFDFMTVACIIESVIGRRITRAEALKIARQIMERAEKERLQLAMREGQRGIRWEEDDDL